MSLNMLGSRLPFHLLMIENVSQRSKGNMKIAGDIAQT
jgi:hypothetical protein